MNLTTFFTMILILNVAKTRAYCDRSGMIDAAALRCIIQVCFQFGIYVCTFVFFCIEMGRSLEFMYAVYAGLEPEGFIELFPYWVVQEDITEIQLDVSIVQSNST